MSISPEDKARFEAAGHEAALSHVETLADQKVPLSQVELLEVHRLIFAQSWPEIAGRFRTENIEITGTSLRAPVCDHPQGGA